MTRARSTMPYAVYAALYPLGLEHKQMTGHQIGRPRRYIHKFSQRAEREAWIEAATHNGRASRIIVRAERAVNLSNAEKRDAIDHG